MIRQIQRQQRIVIPQLRFQMERQRGVMRLFDTDRQCFNAGFKMQNRASELATEPVEHPIIIGIDAMPFGNAPGEQRGE